MSAKANYDQIPAFLRPREEFEGNSMSARWENTHLGRNYIVRSYETVIASVDEQGTVHIDPRKYSKTTSRHQDLCRDWL